MIQRLLVVLAFALSLAAQAADRPTGAAYPIPERYDLVNDIGGLLPIAKRYEIRDKLRALERKNGTQIVLLVVPTTGQEGSEAYSLRVFEQWDPGNNGEGNGVLFLVSGDDRPWIRTGPGIAGVIPDARIARIFRDTEPLVTQGKYAEAVEAAIDALIEAASPEQTSPTFYDYFAAGIHRKYWWAGLLGTIGVLYAGVVLWLRMRRHGKHSS